MSESEQLSKDITRIVISSLGKQIEVIEKEHPLSSEFECDARYTWPDRWEKLKAILIYLKLEAQE